MKFVHMADMHLDSPFVVLANNSKLAVKRRIEQREAMKEIVEYIKQANIPYLFIAGDLYEQEYITKPTIEYVNNLFKEIPNTKIFISPGNHDPYINNSFYKQLEWAENVHVFSENLECIETEEADIYGYGFNNFYMERKYESIKLKNPDKINILITHGSLDASDTTQKPYNPIRSKDLKESGFDYVALGHIHKRSFNDYKGQNIVYPGSTVSLGFDELGERGIIVGEIKSKNLEISFQPIKSRTFEELKIDITKLNSLEELVQELNEQKLEDDKYYKIILIGIKNFDIDKYEIMKLVSNEQIIKIKEETKNKYDIRKIAEQTNLYGLFAERILSKMENASIEEKENLMKAFETGMEILSK